MKCVVLVLVVLSLAVMPVSQTFAQTIEVSGWIPYWESTDGPKDARAHMEMLDVVHPFAFSVTTSGKVKDLAGLSKSSWKRMILEARSEGVLVIPTVMSSNTEAIHTILSNEKNRSAHIKAIVAMVKKGKYDGVDIDYEGKRASTNVYYSQFLQELKRALGTKILSCTIEARTPPDSLYKVVPTNIQYANDFGEINKYCDRVNLMTYDQQRADLKLNDARKGAPYYPVADLEWVRKVITLATKSIDKDKISIGVATYGRETEVTVSPNWYQEYKQLWSVGDEYARDTADTYDVTPSRNKAGELSYSYFSESAPKIPSTIKAPSGTPSGEVAAARALAYANATGKSVTVNLVWWSDAEAIKQKVMLAQQFGLQGVSIFKIDGGEDMDIWDLF